MLKTFEYRIYPTEEQKTLLSKHFGSVRFIYNHFLSICKNSYEVTKKKPSKASLEKQIPSLKTTYPWLKEVNSQSLQASLAHLDKAYQRFFKTKNGFPNFKSKYNKQSFTVPQNLNVSFKEGIITLPKFKEGVKTLFHRRFQGTIRTCTIKMSKTHKYFVSILVEDGTIAPIKPIPSISNAVGIDVGIKDFATLSSGEKISNPRHLNKSLAKLKKTQQILSRRKKGSKNRFKTKQALALLHERVSNQRKDFLHKVSTRLVRENQTLCIETLNVKGMTKNHRLARHIQDLGLGYFFSFLKYKADWYGKNLLSIGMFEPSSKTCSACGGINKDLTLKDREWACRDCGTIHDRDLNAAINIRDFAFIALRNQRELTPISEDSLEPQSRKYKGDNVHNQSLDPSDLLEPRREAHEFIRG